MTKQHPGASPGREGRGPGRRRGAFKRWGSAREFRTLEGPEVAILNPSDEHFWMGRDDNEYIYIYDIFHVV